MPRFRQVFLAAFLAALRYGAHAGQLLTLVSPRPGQVTTPQSCSFLLTARYEPRDDATTPPAPGQAAMATHTNRRTTPHATVLVLTNQYGRRSLFAPLWSVSYISGSRMLPSSWVERDEDERQRRDHDAGSSAC